MKRFKTSDGFWISYEVRGEGRPIIFIHGWASTRNFWHYQMESLSKRALTIALDLRGHGDSDKPLPGNYKLDRMAEDVVELAQALSLREPYLVGHSMGSIIAVIASYSLPAKKIILLSPTHEMPSGIQLLATVVLLKTPIGKYIIPKRLFHKPSRELLEFVYRESAKSSSEIYSEVLMQNSGVKLPDPQPDTDVVLLIPEHDKVINKRYLEGYANRNSAVLMKIPSSGHNAALESPSEVTHLLLKALGIT